MKRRSETTEMLGMVDDFDVRPHRRTGQYVEEPDAEIIHHPEHLRGLATALHE